jgi:hypothetical protein
VALAGEGDDPDEPAAEELFEAALAEAKVAPAHGAVNGDLGTLRPSEVA